MRITELTTPKDTILNIISKDCKPYLDRVGNDRVIFRGMEGFDDTLIRKKVRLDNRKPMSSAQIKHERYNNYFEEMYGAPFRNSLFATGDKGMAAYYGEIFAVYPIGEFDWLWSPAINDMALDIQWPSVSGHINVPPSQEVVDEELSTLSYKINHNLARAVDSGNEIMIRCREYYALHRKLAVEMGIL